MRHPQRGLSLVELMISVAIVGTCVILVVGLFTVMLRTSQKAVDLTSGTVICEGLMSEQANQIMHANSASVKSFFHANYSAPTSLSSGNYGLNSAQFFYQLYVQDVSLPGFSLASVLTDGPCNLKRLDAMVWWFTDPSAAASHSREGYGVLQVQQAQLLWPPAP